MPLATTPLSVRDVILNAAAEAPPGRIDDLVRLHSDLCLQSVADCVKSQTAYADVPVDRVIALGCAFATAGDTWRTAVSRLTCDGWTDAVLNYFDAPLIEECIPAPVSMGPLELLCIGGLCQVSIGNHRLVAGRAWLTAKYGNSAYWKQVKLRYEPLTGTGRELLSQAAEANSGLRVAIFHSTNEVSFGGGEVIRRVASLSSRPTQVYGMGKKALLPIKNPWHFHLHRNLAWTNVGKIVWSEIPADMVKRMLDDTWITSQL